MESIRNTAASLCITLIVSGIFSMLLPGGGWNRYAKFGVRLFLLLCLILPFGKGEFDILSGSEGILYSTEEIGEDWEMLTQKQLLENFSENLEQEAENLLGKSGIETEKIEAEVHIADEQRIDISNIRITLKPGMEGAVQKTEALIAQTFGITPVVTCAQQGGTQNE